MHYCLNKSELGKLLDYKLGNIIIEENELKNIVDNSHDWRIEISSFNYLFTQILERKVRNHENGNLLIKKYYEFPNEFLFSIQEFDNAFIDFMMNNYHDNSIPLEEELVNLQNNLSSYNYDKIIRR